jgi:hypothetical protein
MEYLYLLEYQVLAPKCWAFKLIGYAFEARRQRATAVPAPGYFSWISAVTAPLNAP